jgi:hypothetical protein
MQSNVKITLSDDEYKQKNFVDKIKALFDMITSNFNNLQEHIYDLRKEYDDGQLDYKNIIIERNDILCPDPKIFDKEYIMRKNMLQNDLMYTVNNRDIIFIEFYQDIFTTLENMMSLEIGINPKKNEIGYDSYKNNKLKNIRQDIEMDTQIVEELNKLKNIVVESCINIENNLKNYEEYTNSFSDEFHNGLDTTTFSISMRTLFKKINLELESNKFQFIYQMEDDLVKIYSINKKSEFMKDMASLSS